MTVIGMVAMILVGALWFWLIVIYSTPEDGE